VRSRKSIGLVLIVAGLALASACAKTTSTQAVGTPAAGAPAKGGSSDFTGNPDGPYCRAALQNAATDLTPRAKTPETEKKYWNDYVAFLATEPPTEIKSDLKVFRDHMVNTVMPVLRKYDFDEARFEKEATPAEKKVMDDESSPPNVQAAFHRIASYEWQVCGNGTPDDATEVKFSGDKDSAYCKAEAAGHEAFGKIADEGFKPEALKAFVTGETLATSLASKERLAPQEIKSDVAADVNWTRTKQTPVFAKYGYDIRKVKLQGTPKERFAMEMSDVSIRDAERRLNAYDEQVCGL